MNRFATEARWRRRQFVAAALAVAALAGIGGWRLAVHATGWARPASVAALRVAVDPETGELGLPSPEQMQELVPPAASTGDLVVETRPDGSKHVSLRGRFLDYSVVRVGDDGRLERGCVQGTDAARQFVVGTGDAATAPPAAASVSVAPALEEK